jgi:FAD/FMN-containing dehydrogenase
MTSLQAKKVDELKARVQGDVVLPQDEAYDSARTIWNAMVDKHPALIVRCAVDADVVGAVNFARDNGLPLAVRGGGHNIAGSALCDGGIVVDLSKMKSVRVDAGARRASVEGGATLGDFDAAAQAHGLATPLGINSTTGVAGLTLGAGFGWLSRKYGMTIDNLESAEVVTAAGEVLRASASEHPDLFWALRGGSGNFGAVTRFEFRLHPVGPNLLSGLIVYPLAEAEAVLQRYRDFVAAAPDELTVWTVLRKAPPLPFLPEKVHGQEVVVLALLYAGDPGAGQALIEPLRRFGNVQGEHIGVQPYAAWQQAFDPLLTPGARNYWKSHNFATLDDGLFDAVIEYVGKLPSPQCEIFFGAIGGATARPKPDATAYPHRDARFVMNVHGRWDGRSDDERCIAWSRAFFNASAPYASGGAYVNFLTADEGDRVRAAYGSNYERLAQVKRKYDPANLFSTNQNIKPA